MDPRRFLIPAAAGALVAGCAQLVDRPSGVVEILAPPAPVPRLEPPASLLAARSPTERPYRPVAAPIEVAAEAAPSGATGRTAIATANAAARAASRSDGFVGGVQVFAWSPGRVYEVWTAPLRVTALTLAPGETLLAKAAGDTVRWQIGETTSGAGAAARVHVLLKPLQRGLETNLVLTTDRRVYLIDLKSGGAEAFNTAVAWESPDAALGNEPTAPTVEAEPVAGPQGPLDTRYRIESRGRRPRWTPTSVFNDGIRTFIAFDADLQVYEAPVLFVLTPDGETRLVNYRQQGGLFVVDRLFDRAELRLGGRRPQVVRIHRLAGPGR